MESRLSKETASLIEALAPPPSARQSFSPSAKQALLTAVKEHQWTTARDAYGWAWTNLGLRVSYLTVWRFLNSHDLFNEGTPGARRLRSSPTSL